MAQIPEMEPTVASERSLPVTPTPDAPAGAFPFAVGDALTRTQAQLEQAAAEGRALAAKEQADAASTKYLNASMQIRSKYGEQQQENAIKAYPQAIEALNKVRDEIAGGMQNRRAADLFRDGSLYTQRHAMEWIDSHFNSERRSYNLAVYRRGVESYASELAFNATGNAKGSFIDTAFDDLKSYVSSKGAALGFSGEQLEAWERHELQGPVTGMLKTLLANKSPLSQIMFDKYGAYAEPSMQASVSKAVFSLDVKQQAASAFESIPRVDEAGTENKIGKVDTGKYNELVEKLKADPTPKNQAILEEVERHKLTADNQFQRQVRSMFTDLSAKFRGKDGKVHIDGSDVDFRELEALSKPMADKLREQEIRGTKQTTVEEKTQHRDQDRKDLGNFMLKLNTMDHDDVLKMGLDQIKGELPTADSPTLVRAYNAVKRLQKADPIAVKARDTNITVAAVLKDAAPTNDAFIKNHRADAAEYALQLQEENPDISRDDLRKRLQDWAVAKLYDDKGLVSKMVSTKPPEPYKPQPKQAGKHPVKKDTGSGGAGAGPQKGEEYLDFDEKGSSTKKVQE